MKKKRILSLMTLATVIVYLICLAFIYFTSFNLLTLLYKIACFDEWQYLYETVTDYCEDSQSIEEADLNLSEKIFDIQLEFMNHGYDKIAFFDREGNLLAKTGVYLKIALDGKEEPVYCNIDDFLTDDMRDELADFYKNNVITKTEHYDEVEYFNEMLNRFKVSEFSYNITDGRIIPVRIIIKSSYTGKSTEIIFSDEKAEKEFVFNEGNEAVILLSEYLIDGDRRLEEANEIMSSESFLNDVRNCTGEGIGSQDAEMGCWITPIKAGEKEIVMFFYTVREPFSITLLSDDFLEPAAACTGVFIILGAFLFFYLKKITEKNEQLEISRVAFTSGAAHELKTPLTVITNQCECIIENISPEKNDDYINSIYTEALRMNKLVATLLQYNKVNSISSVKKEKTDMQIIAETEIDKYSWHFEEKNLDLQVNLAEAAINCNDELIALVVDNFLSNAVKHTKEGGIVKVSLEKERKHVKFSVFNEGEHISSVDAKHIWEEFYKKDKARSRNDNSTGMGLAVCKRILSLHGFKYGYKNVKGGVEFYFIAPSK
ncbi:MAG: hypothetical protein J6D06_04680 [Clostridia bacterium]|nr:hypothetical protein [Clostridia bacterium]